MAREIVLDTETTGLDPRTGHRLIEIACIEVEDLLPTGRHFHCYIDPCRDIDPEAERVHGISRSFLSDKPRFETPEVCDAFLEFIGDATLVAHNAPFDRGFINSELVRAGRTALPDERWVCTFVLAQKRFPGMYNSLDALCKRFKISLAEREKHGALVDTRLLSMVYLELQGGKERGLDFVVQTNKATEEIEIKVVAYQPRSRPLAPRATPEELEAHLGFIRSTLKDQAIWFGKGLLPREG